MSELVVDRVKAFAEKLLPSMDLELVEVQFRREGHGWVLRLFVDGEDGVNHDHCSRVSREVGDFLYVEDIIEHAYSLEVSSPGLERSLRSIGDYQRFVGRKARVKLLEGVEGQRVFIGEIRQVDGEAIELTLEDGETVVFSFDNINKARLTI